jgi:hypothetical protein
MLDCMAGIGENSKARHKASKAKTKAKIADDKVNAEAATPK